MSTEHPITPPPELLQQWATEYWGNPGESIGEGEKYIATQAARWGADAELEACCEWLPSDLTINGESLRDVRRPKPPSLAEQALMALDEMNKPLGVVTGHRCDTIHRALERLKELEKGNE